jgi:hypothetical protein
MLIGIGLMMLALPPAGHADDIAQAVDARRGRTMLSKRAAEMTPGTWAELKTEMPPGLWRSPRVDDNARHVVARIKKNGSLERLKDAPVELGIRSDKLTVDPLSGCYLIMHRDHKLYEFDSDRNEYRLIDDFSRTPWPFHRYDMPIVAFIPEYGVIMWADSKVWLYKHKAEP